MPGNRNLKIRIILIISIGIPWILLIGIILYEINQYSVRRQLAAQLTKNRNRYKSNGAPYCINVRSIGEYGPSRIFTWDSIDQEKNGVTIAVNEFIIEVSSKNNLIEECIIYDKNDNIIIGMGRNDDSFPGYMVMYPQIGEYAKHYELRDSNFSGSWKIKKLWTFERIDNTHNIPVPGENSNPTTKSSE